MTNMENLNLTFQFNKKTKITLAILIFIGLAALVYGILTYSPEKVWSALLLNSINFLTIGLGATFFIAIHIITQFIALRASTHNSGYDAKQDIL